MKNIPTVFVVDDDPSVRKSLSRLLRSAGYEVEAFASGEEFLRREPCNEGGCIILDVRMRGLDGMGVQEKLSRQDYAMPVIFITGHGNIPMSVRAMKRGAIDFLQKPFDDGELLRAVEMAIKQDGEARAEREEADQSMKQVKRLTPREFEILRHVISGMLNKQIAFKLGIAEKTVKIHRGHIMEKLGAQSVADLVRFTGKIGIEPAGDVSEE